jgi:two-component system, response regulator PdtaR
MNRPLNILVVEDDPLIAEDIKGYLLEFGHRVSGPASSCDQARRLVVREMPDAAILDINLGGSIMENDTTGNGCALAAWLNEHHPMPFIYLSSHSDEDTLAQARATHPGGYVLKPFTGSDIRVALDVALSNFAAMRDRKARPLDPEAMYRVLEDPLSIQELRILACVEEGLTNRQAADRLFISENTVKTHLKHIFSKLNVRNRTEAIHKARSLSRG